MVDIIGEKALNVELKKTGPIWLAPFQGIINRGVDEMVMEAAEEGAVLVKAQLYPGHGFLTGFYHSQVHAERRDRLHAVVTDSGVIYGPWLEGISDRNSVSRFKGYAMFRRALEMLKADIPKYTKKSTVKLVGRLN